MEVKLTEEEFLTSQGEVGVGCVQPLTWLEIRTVVPDESEAFGEPKKSKKKTFGPKPKGITPIPPTPPVEPAPYRWEWLQPGERNIFFGVLWNRGTGTSAFCRGPDPTYNQMYPLIVFRQDQSNSPVEFVPSKADEVDLSLPSHRAARLMDFAPIHEKPRPLTIYQELEQDDLRFYRERGFNPLEVFASYRRFVEGNPPPSSANP